MLNVVFWWIRPDPMWADEKAILKFEAQIFGLDAVEIPEALKDEITDIEDIPDFWLTAPTDPWSDVHTIN